MTPFRLARPSAAFAPPHSDLYHSPQFLRKSRRVKFIHGSPFEVSLVQVCLALLLAMAAA